MLWDTTMQSILGYMSAMMWNQNNVDASASPVTTQFELIVGQQLCQLIGYSAGKDAGNLGETIPRPWAHITGCGSVANLEALWAARNLKFHPLAVKSTLMDDDLKPEILKSKVSFSSVSAILQKFSTKNTIFNVTLAC